MVNNEVSNNEWLYRLVLNKPNYWKENENRVSSAAFKDSKGVSVDRDGERPESKIIEELNHRFIEKIGGIVKIQAGFCRNSGAIPLSKPEVDNVYHCIIIGKESVELTNSIARQLSKNAITVMPFNQQISNISS